MELSCNCELRLHCLYLPMSETISCVGDAFDEKSKGTSKCLPNLEYILCLMPLSTLCRHSLRKRLPLGSSDGRFSSEHVARPTYISEMLILDDPERSL
jgi:hypothetical protein